ncbi:hypothetical protein ABZ705_23360 [Streptomyces sp. NPDC006984]|uniref:hypothetical protein n=1 Tax=Streptomyces sp. NPDC006984 TaxID=3155463 RepID=UPI0033D297DB
MTDTSPSRFLRIVLRVDSFATSSAGTITLIVALLALVFTDTAAGVAVATVLFVAWVAVGWTGRRHQRLGGRSRTAETDDVRDLPPR